MLIPLHLLSNRLIKSDRVQHNLAAVVGRADASDQAGGADGRADGAGGGEAGGDAELG